MIENLLKWKRYAKGFLIPVLSPNKMKPHVVAESILDIDFEGLKREGFRHVVFDKDNTLTDHDVHYIKESAFHEKIADVERIFGKDNVAVFTNNLVVTKIEDSHLQVISSTVKKPDAGSVIETFFNDRFSKSNSYCNKFYDETSCVVIGDRLLTDVV